MILILTVFILGLVFVSFWNGRYILVSIPKQSLELSAELAKNFSNTNIPQYVLTYGWSIRSTLIDRIQLTYVPLAPLVFLDKGDLFYPSDLVTHVSNTHPELNHTTIKDTPERLTLDNLNILNDVGGDKVYLTSTENLIKLPNYLKGEPPNKKTLQTGNAISCVIALAEKADGILDAFYIYFYTFNEGPTALGHRVGNHLGDWYV